MCNNSKGLKDKDNAGMLSEMRENHKKEEQTEKVNRDREGQSY